MSELEQSLLRWAQAGLLTTDQAARIREFEQNSLPAQDDFGISIGSDTDAMPVSQADDIVIIEEPATSQRSAIAVEALAYVGGALFLIGLGVLLSDQWGQIEAGGHFTVSMVAAALMFVGGLGLGKTAVPSYRRIGSVLWALSTVFFGGGIGLLFGEVIKPSDNVSAFLVSAITSIYACVLYRFRRALLQQVNALVSVIFTICAFINLLDLELDVFWYACVIAVVGAAWLLFTWAGVIKPQRDGVILGALTALISVQVMAVTVADAGLVIGLIVASVFIVIGVTASSIPLFILGAIALFAFGYESVLHWFGSSVITNAGLLLVGAAMLVGVILYVQLKGRK